MLNKIAVDFFLFLLTRQICVDAGNCFSCRHRFVEHPHKTLRVSSNCVKKMRLLLPNLLQNLVQSCWIALNQLPKLLKLRVIA